jgi:membrane-bound serine protease (ClpP class)
MATVEVARRSVRESVSARKRVGERKHPRAGVGHSRAVLERLIVASLLLLAVLGGWGSVAAQTNRPLVYVVPIEGTIDLGLAPFLARTIIEAQQAGADAVLLDINTFGGRVDAAVAMRDTLVNAPIRTIAFVHPRAISAGALIALATETIVMADGGTIGAAMPVVSGSDAQVS